MTEVELAKALRKSNYTCEGVNCEECKKTNYIKQCLMSDVQIYCDDILGADDNYIEKLEKENEEMKNLIEIQYQENQTLGNNNAKLLNMFGELKAQIEDMKNVGNCEHALNCARFVQQHISSNKVTCCKGCSEWEMRK